MNDSRITYLFQAYFNKSATQKESEELMQLLIKTENDDQIKGLLAATWQQFESQNQLFDDEQREKMLSNILKQEIASQPVLDIAAYKKPFRWFRVAAAAAVLFFVVITISLWLNHNDQKQQITETKNASNHNKNAIVPGSNKAMLTLSDGSTIILDSAYQGTLIKQGNSNVNNLKSAILIYKSTNSNSKEIFYNTLSTPKGGQYQLILPDNTKVWLNSSSSIYFPTTFTGKERNVTVTGEAYFEVAKNPSMPFKISAQNVTIQVLGTHFNVMAYEDENSINTTLLEGSIKVSNGSFYKVLVPGQESRINETGSIDVAKADIDEVMAWKNGWFQFNSYPITKIMREISRWYNIEVVYEGEIPTGHFSGVVSRGNDISKVLKIMEAGGVRFKIDGRKLVVL